MDLQATEIQPGKYGGRLILLKHRPHFIPSFVFGSPTNSLEYSPKRFIQIMQEPRVAKAFGFEEKPNGYFSIPDQKELQGAIDYFNASLTESDKDARITVKYYAVSGAETPRTYLNRFAKESAFPIASEGHLLIHDVTAHATAILIPPSVWEAAQNQIRALLEFEAWLKDTDPKFHATIDFDMAYKAEANRIDFSNANIFDLFSKGVPLSQKNEFRRTKKGVFAASDLQMAQHEISKFVSDGKSPESYLKERLKKGQTQEAFRRFSEIKKENQEAWFFKTPSPKTLSVELIYNRISELNRIAVQRP